jgi:hypothetical protein
MHLQPARASVKAILDMQRTHRGRANSQDESSAGGGICTEMTRRALGELAPGWVAGRRGVGDSKSKRRGRAVLVRGWHSAESGSEPSQSTKRNRPKLRSGETGLMGGSGEGITAGTSGGRAAAKLSMVLAVAKTSGFGDEDGGRSARRESRLQYSWKRARMMSWNSAHTARSLLSRSACSSCSRSS